MSQGPLGYESRRLFVWKRPHDSKLASYLLLHSADEPVLAFLVLPLSELPQPHAAAVLAGIRCDGRFVRPECEWYLIAIPYPSGGEIRTTVNLRAPIVVDPRTGLSRQVVLGGNGLSFTQSL